MVSKPNYVGFFLAASLLFFSFFFILCSVAVFKFPFFPATLCWHFLFLFYFFLLCSSFFLWAFVCRSFTFTFTVPYPYHISRVWSGAVWGRGLCWLKAWGCGGQAWGENPLATGFRKRKSLQIPTSNSQSACFKSAKPY